MVLTRTLAMAMLLLAAGAYGQPPAEEDFYRIDTIAIPAGTVLEAGAIEELPDGRIAVATRRGEIWIAAGALADPPREVTFARYAHGLHEVLGLFHRDGALYATQRCELTRIRDQDGDDRGDLFETVSDGWGVSGDYHEYAFGSPPDAEGNVWIALCLTGSFSSEVPYRGWCLRVTPDGKTLPTCSGIRSPGGIGFNAAGDVFYTDNQGPWNGTCSLKQLRPGGFLGHPAGNRWYDLAGAPGPRPIEPRDGGRLIDEVARIKELIPPAVYFPYQKMGQSASGIVCDRSQGKFGPFADQLFVADQAQSTLMRVFLERIQGEYQGACFPFRAGFASGALALKQTHDGSVLVGGTNRGWGSRGTQSYSLERLVWTGKTPFEVHEMRIKPDGFELQFTESVGPEAAKPDSYSMQTYTYIYQSTYGSPEVDATRPRITRVEANERTVRLYVDKLQPGHVHELHMDGVRSRRGQPLLHREAYYTANYLP